MNLVNIKFVFLKSKTSPEMYYNYWLNKFQMVFKILYDY